jgi:hypothetical protein
MTADGPTESLMPQIVGSQFQRVQYSEQEDKAIRFQRKYTLLRYNESVE